VSSPTQHSFPWRITAIVVVLVAAATIIAGVLLARQRVGADDAPTPVATASASAPVASPLPLADQRQLTVLLTVRDEVRAAVSTVLIGVGGDTGFVSELMLPRDLLLPTVPPMRLREADDPTGDQTAQTPLETLLGVRVDALLDLDRLAWSGLIDATGSRVDLAAAEQPGSFGLVLDRVLKGLPYEPETVGELLTGLGSMARTTVTNEDSGYLLSVLGRRLRTEEVKRQVLPVTYLRAGQARAAVADVSQTEAVVQELFPEALLEPGHGGTPRVVLQRAGASLGAATDARLALTQAGFGVIEDRSPTDPVDATVVLAADPADDPGMDAAEALGLPATSVQADSASPPTVDVRILLGTDATLSGR
jgi:hypothetical protein